MQMFWSGETRMEGYLARPAAVARAHAILICHGSEGATPWHQDVARRLAKAGYVALVVDLLSRHGGTAAVRPNERGALLAHPDAETQWLADYGAAAEFLRQQPFVDPEDLGLLGFGFGGLVAWTVAAQDVASDLGAVVIDDALPAADLGLDQIRAAVLGCYGALDRPTTALPDLEARLRKAGVRFALRVYPDAGGAFYDDTRPRTSRAGFASAAAVAAWHDTLAWFASHLGEDAPAESIPPGRWN